MHRMASSLAAVSVQSFIDDEWSMPLAQRFVVGNVIVVSEYSQDSE